MPYRFQFNWKLGLFVLVFLPLTLRLGFWQLDRADQKRVLIKEHQALITQPALGLDEVKASELADYQPVKAKGRFLPLIYLVDNQVSDGKVGYEVVQGFELQSSKRLWVSRGYVPGDVDREKLPQIKAPEFVVQLSGYAYQPKLNALLEGADTQATVAKTWPKVIQQLSAENLYNLLPNSDKIGAPFQAPYIMRLDENSAYIFKAHWMVVNNTPQKHLGYAVQWFAMAALLVVLFILASLKKRGSE